MNIETATDFITTNKDQDIIITLVDGTEVGGTALSVNSKGVNIKRDGKTRSFSISRVDTLALVNDMDTESDEDIYAMLSDGMTTADLAAALSDHLSVSIEPKELRVHLRALGLGVGKGRKYSLSATEYRMVRDLIKADATA